MLFKHSPKLPSSPAADAKVCLHPKSQVIHQIDTISRNPAAKRASEFEGPSLGTDCTRAGRRGLPKAQRRHTSLPQTLPSSLQAQIDIDNDRIARGLASPPIINLARFEDTRPGPKSDHYEGLVSSRPPSDGRTGHIKSILKRPVPPIGMDVSISRTLRPSEPARARKPDPRHILMALADLPELGALAASLLEAEEFLRQHEIDLLDFDERDALRSRVRQGQRTGSRKGNERQDMTVFGEPLRQSSIYASTTMLLGGREHELPIVVGSSVEELYRTGIYQSNLFRTLPNRSRLLELISIFDSEIVPPDIVARSRTSSPKSVINAAFGADVSLHLETTPDICALLSTYLSSLPEPVLLPCLFRPMWEWCGIGRDELETVKPQPIGLLSSSIPMARSYTNQRESRRILIAQLLLHLLPSPNFSLLVYLLAFFSQVALVRDENGVGIEDLAKMFGSRLFGGDHPLKVSVRDGREGRPQGERMMCWFLRRWGLLSDGLFEVLDVVEPPLQQASGDHCVKKKSDTSTDVSAERSRILPTAISPDYPDFSMKAQETGISPTRQSYSYFSDNHSDNNEAQGPQNSKLQHHRGSLVAAKSEAIAAGLQNLVNDIQELQQEIEKPGSLEDNDSVVIKPSLNPISPELDEQKRRETDSPHISHASGRSNQIPVQEQMPNIVSQSSSHSSTYSAPALDDRLLDYSMPNLLDESDGSSFTLDVHEQSGAYTENKGLPLATPAYGGDAKPEAFETQSRIKDLEGELSTSQARAAKTTDALILAKLRINELEGQLVEIKKDKRRGTGIPRPGHTVKDVPGAKRPEAIN